MTKEVTEITEIVYTCDRCKTPVTYRVRKYDKEPIPSGWLRIETWIMGDANNTATQYHFCSSCQTRFVDWKNECKIMTK